MRGPVGKQLFIPSCSVSAHSMARRGHADLGNAANMWIDKEMAEGCMYNAMRLADRNGATHLTSAGSCLIPLDMPLFD